MLETWKKCYLEVREKIEQSGRDTRWEFDRKRLFERSDHIAQICKDICDIARVCTCTPLCNVTIIFCVKK